MDKMRKEFEGWWNSEGQKITTGTKGDALIAWQAARAQPAGEAVAWGAPKTVSHLIRQLQTMDQEMPVHGAIFVDKGDGRRVAKIRPITLSRERVDGQWIKQGDKSVPYQLVIWSAAQEAPPAQMTDGWKLVPKEPTPEIMAAAAIAAWPQASADDVAMGKKAALIVMQSMQAAPGVTLDMLAATLATMAPAYRSMLAAAPQSKRGGE